MQMPRGSWKLFLRTAILAGIFAGNSSLSLAAETRFAGYLLDRSCADNLKAQGVSDSVQHHKKECALNAGCSRDGYAILSKGQWYRLDKKGNELARHLLESTKTKEGHFVVVSGSNQNGEISVNSLKELAQNAQE